MIVRHLRNATALLSIGEHRLVVDPMLSDPGAMPGFKLVGGGRRRNPLVPLPPGADEALAAATGVLITHEHPDHFDGPGLRWVKERKLPVWTSGVDAPNLARKGLDVRELGDAALGMSVEIVRSRHGRGPLGWLMGPVSGYYLAHPSEPSLYLVGDSVLTESVTEAVARLQPDVIVAPAGAANVGLGGDILFSVDELIALAKLARGQVVFNHLEALDHCPTTREGLRKRLADERLSGRAHVPEDGESLHFERLGARAGARPRPAVPRGPGLQKWVTAWFTGT
jgi:L-ascorbate metabolism protein UlaG (beta-lactamase superfamily)